MSKMLAKKVKESLLELGYDISIGHCYELLSKLSKPSGRQDDPSILGVEVPKQQPEKKTYRILLKADAVVEKVYHIEAGSRDEAQEILRDYVDFSLPIKDLPRGVPSVLRDEVEDLMDFESDYDFWHSNWAVSTLMGKTIEVSSVDHF